MNKTLQMLILAVGILAIGTLSTGCLQTASPLTTQIEIQTSQGAFAKVSSPKDTTIGSFVYHPESGSIELREFSSLASDPTAAYTGVIQAQGQIAIEQSRLISQLLGGAAGSSPAGSPPAPPANE